MKKWGLRLPAAEANAFLHWYQVAAHMLGVKDEYIPATWDAANAQAPPRSSTPCSRPLPKESSWQTSCSTSPPTRDGGVLSRPLLESLTRYFLGEGDRRMAPHSAPPGTGRDARPRLAAVCRRDGAVLPGVKELYWTFDEVLRLGALWYLGEGQQLFIEIPDTNNPNHS